ncbi:type 1 periplasmic-binding domain-containing protein, partial [Gordonibacter urolithinfaciens]
EQPDTEEPAEGADAPESEADSGSDITQEEVVKYILEKNPSIKGCYTTNEEAAKLAVEACESLEREDMKVISFDGGKDQLELLKEEKL